VILPPRALEWLVSEGADKLDECPDLGPKRAARYEAKLRELCDDG
jgi:ribonuclease D